MPIPQQIEWSAPALKQFDQIITYLEERNPSAARRIGQAIFSKVEFIGQFPQAHRQILGLPSNYREAFVENYRLLYSLTGSDKIRLLSIRHTRQRPLSAKEIIEISHE
jgi:plasmid stabilization system protein ParE